MADVEKAEKFVNAVIGAMSVYDQYQLAFRQGLDLSTVTMGGYGVPSEATIARFGPDGKMRDPRVQTGGRTYES